MWVSACSTCTASAVTSPPSPIGPIPVSFSSSNSSRSSFATSGSGFVVPTGRAIASFARYIVVGRAADPHAHDSWWARLAARADDRLEHELLDPLYAVGGDAHLEE